MSPRNGRPWTNMFKSCWAWELSIQLHSSWAFILPNYLSWGPIRLNPQMDVQLPLEWLALVFDQGMIFWASYYPRNRGCSPSSQTWHGGLPRCLTWTQEKNLQLAGNFSQIYLIEVCRSLEVLDIQVAIFSSHLQWQEKDGYFTRLHPQVQ